MKKLSIIVIVACCLMATACDQDKKSPKFQLLTAGKNIYRLNTQSGEIIVFSQNGIKKYDDDYISKALQKESGLSQLKTDKSKTFPESNGQMWTILSYKWRNDKILYRYTFGPYSGKLQKALNDFSSSITLNFLDKDGFPVVTQIISLSSLIRIVDEDGRPLYWQKEGKISCSKDDYLLITSNSISWSFSKSLRESVNNYAKILEKEHRENWDKLKELIKSGKILGKIKGDNIFIKRENGYKKLNRKDYTLVELILKNAELIKSFQIKGNKKALNENNKSQIGQ